MHIRTIEAVRCPALSATRRAFLLAMGQTSCGRPGTPATLSDALASSQLIVIVEILGGIRWVAHNIDGVSIQNRAYLRVVIRGNIIRLLYGLTKNSEVALISVAARALPFCRRRRRRNAL